MKNAKGKNFKSKRKPSYKPKNESVDGAGKQTNIENDIRWYDKYPTMIGPNASINFNKRYGAPIKTMEVTTAYTANQGFVETTVPGVVVYRYVPMYADAANISSAVNVAAKNLYTYVRHANSGSVNYETSDLMQYLVTIFNLYTQIEQVKRDLRIVHTYNGNNKYVGMYTLKAIRGIAYSNALLHNTATLTGYLNTIIGKLNSFKIPQDISLLDRHLWLSSNVFKDDELEKYTQYVAITDYIAHYDWQNQEVNINKVTFSDPMLLLDAINAEIDSLLSYEDIGIMIGDILKAYKSEGCRVIAPMGLGEILIPNYSAELIQQLRNATVPGYFDVGTEGYNIKQMTGNSQIIYAEQKGFTRTDGRFIYHSNIIGTRNQGPWFVYNQSLSIDSDHPSNEEIILSSRLSLTFGADSSNDGDHITLYNYCSEIPDSFEVWSFTGDPNDINGDEPNQSVDKAYSFYELGSFNDLDNAMNNLTGMLASINQLHKATGTIGYTIWINYKVNSDDVFGITNYYNGKNVITLNREWLDRLHTACKLSLFTMPMFKLLEN